MTKIRKASLNDIDEIINLVSRTIDISYAPYYSEEGMEFYKLFHSKRALKRSVKNEYMIVLEKDDGKIIGTGTLVGFYIIRVFIDPSYQGHGYGKQIMNNLEKFAELAGIKELHLSASLPSVDFYISLAYIVVKRGSSLVKNNEQVDYFKMKKVL